MGVLAHEGGWSPAAQVTKQVSWVDGVCVFTLYSSLQEEEEEVWTSW